MLIEKLMCQHLFREGQEFQNVPESTSRKKGFDLFFQFLLIKSGHFVSAEHQIFTALVENRWKDSPPPHIPFPVLHSVSEVARVHHFLFCNGETKMRKKKPVPSQLADKVGAKWNQQYINIADVNTKNPWKPCKQEVTFRYIQSCSAV